MYVIECNRIEYICDALQLIKDVKITKFCVEYI